VVTTAVIALLALLIGFCGAFWASSWRRKVKRTYAVHMKPGCGPTVEGLLVASSRREFRLLNVTLLESADQSHALANPVRVLRENVFCLEELE
jgi:hypothetical protein